MILKWKDNLSFFRRQENYAVLTFIKLQGANSDQVTNLGRIAQSLNTPEIHSEIWGFATCFNLTILIPAVFWIAKKKKKDSRVKNIMALFQDSKQYHCFLGLCPGVLVNSEGCF